MELIVSLVYIPVILSMVFIGVTTFTYRERQYVSYFASMLLVGSVWLMMQYIAQMVDNGSGRLAVSLLQTASAMAGFLGVFFMMFAVNYAGIRLTRVSIAAMLLPALLFVPLNYTDMMISAAHASPYGITIDNVGPLYYAEIAMVAIYFIVGVIFLARYIVGLPKKQRQKNYLLVAAMLQAAVLLVLTASPAITDSMFQLLIPLSLGIMSTLITISIVRHGLFNIRTAAIRFIAYIFSLIVLGLVYYFVAYIVSVVILGGFAGSEVSIDPVNFILALTLAFLFQPTKRFFDRATDRIFFRDQYSLEDFYEHLSSTLTSTTELRTLLEKATTEIGTTLKASQALLYVRYNSSHHITVGTAVQKHFDGASIDVLDEYVQQKGYDVIARELLLEGEHLQRVMARGKFGIILPLYMRASGRTSYLMLGERLSGAYSKRDLRALTAISNELTIAIQNTLSVQEIRDINASLERRIEEATAKLTRTNDRLRKLDETKDEFISMASHQLRTPLTSVKGYISMVLDGDAGKLTTEQRKILEQAFGSSQRMVYLIGDFLNVSRIQTGKFEIEHEPVNLAGVVSQEINQLVETAKTKRITMTYEVPENFPTINADENKLRQVMMNFMDNAIYYSPADTKIKVQLYKDAGSVVFKVTDQGIGVPKSDQPKLFTKFFRAPNAKQQRPDGTGIGLYMAKKVIVGHHGTVIFETKEGKGSTFGFRLPMKETK